MRLHCITNSIIQGINTARIPAAWGGIRAVSLKQDFFLFDLTQLGGNKLDEKALGEIEGLLLDCLECLLQIGDQVVGILGTDGQADGVLVDALVQQFLLAELAVGGGGRVDDQALNVSNVSQQAEDLQVVDERMSFLHRFLQYLPL